VSRFLGIDHVDLRVPSLAAVEGFYGALLPKLGLTKKSYSFVDALGEWADASAERYNVAEWYEESDEDGRPKAFFGVIEDTDMSMVRTRVAFAVASRAEVHRWAQELPALGAREIELSDDGGRYVAVFFTDPLGTRLEIVARAPRL
jgi:catechol 2,3-dioxygenase-like lactoylglutathione lyase family enzyme